jgi:hypothetical protein
MIPSFIQEVSIVGRRTLSLPDAIEALVRENARQGESFSATAARLIEQGAASMSGKKVPAYVGSGEGPRDLGRMAESYLRKLVTAR